MSENDYYSNSKAVSSKCILRNLSGMIPLIIINDFVTKIYSYTILGEISFQLKIPLSIW